MNYKAILSQKGYRLSAPRKQIIELLEVADVALSPQQIHNQLQQNGSALGLVSVYRTLGLLTELGLVTILYDPQLNPGYVLRTQGHHHHIVCQMISTALSSAWRNKPLSRYVIIFCNFSGSAPIVNNLTLKEFYLEEVNFFRACSIIDYQCLRQPETRCV
jgi:Fur family ferric uptake transcriptional regulator